MSSLLKKVLAVFLILGSLLLDLGTLTDTVDLSTSVQLQDHPLTGHRQVPSDCRLPCNCTQEPTCKAGVNIIDDGCGCCPMCARQQGDLCNSKDKCDEERGLYCHHTGSDFKGICRAKKGKPCIVDGKEYQDGVQFNPNCSLLCTCQDGKYACSSKCPQELRAPSSVHCRDSHLVPIKDRCCKEWVCPHQHMGSSNDKDNSTASDHCKKESTNWSGCSVSCGMGESIRVTSDNSNCKPVQERRLCMIRPCATESQIPHGKKCRSIYEVPEQKIRFENCESEDQYKMKYCSTCKKNKCCGPIKVKTSPVTFICPENKRFTKPVMFIKTCKCHRQKDCPFY